MTAKAINILWLVSEDCPPRGSAFGDPLIATPNIDRLAERGVLFENAFSTYPVCAPSRFSLITGMEPASSGPAHHMRAIAKVPSDFKTYAELFRSAGYYCTNNSKTDYNCDLDESLIWDDSSSDAHWRNRTPGQPFLAVFNLDVTHESAVFSEKVSDVSEQDVLVPSYLPDTPEIRADLARHYTAVKKMDDQFGDIIAQLEEDGLIESTLVVYSSDHGGVSPRSKRFCYDEGLRVPLVFAIPERFARISHLQHGTRVKNPVSLIDIAPTLLHLAGLVIPENMHGVSLFQESGQAKPGVAFGGRDRMDERYDFVRTARTERFRYIRNYYPDRPNGQHIGFMFLAEGYQSWERQFIEGKLNEVQSSFWLERPAEELYDIVEDPEQTQNLALNQKFTSQLKELRLLVDDRIVEVNDNGFIPEGHALEGYFSSRTKAEFPIREVLELANLAIQRDPGQIDFFIRSIQDEGKEILRYWAAIGLRLSSDSLSNCHQEVLQCFRREQSDYVRLVLAEILAKQLDSGEAIAALVDYLSEDKTQPLRLMSLNSLVYVKPELLTEYLMEIENIAGNPDPILSSAAKYLKFVIQKSYQPEMPTFDLGKFLQSISAEGELDSSDLQAQKK
jgi:arylsulfatase A-like enzyme